ncbi:MAG: bile acid:sodium symporter [Myxococcota bacterium]
MQDLQAFAESVLVPAQLVLAMLGMGCTLRMSDFTEVLRTPRGLLLGLALQLGLVPLLASGFVAVFDLGPGFAVGLFLVAVVPGGASSNLLTYLGRGNVALSIALTTVSTVGCVLTVPLLMSVLAEQQLPPDFRFPGRRILIDISRYLVLPLSVGMGLLHRWPRVAEALSPWAIRGSIAAVLAVAAISLKSGRIDVGAYGWGAPVFTLGFAFVLALVVPHVVRLAGRDDADALALTIEVVVRNVSIGLLMVSFFFPGRPEQAELLYVCLLYAGTSTLAVAPLIVLHRFGWSPVLGRRAAPLGGARSVASSARDT